MAVTMAKKQYYAYLLASERYGTLYTSITSINWFITKYIARILYSRATDGDWIFLNSLPCADGFPFPSSREGTLIRGNDILPTQNDIEPYFASIHPQKWHRKCHFGTQSGI